MFCHNCGASCPEYARFCHQCGANLIIEVPAAVSGPEYITPETPAQAPAAAEFSQPFAPVQPAPQVNPYLPQQTIQLVSQVNPYMSQQSAPAASAPGIKGTHWIPIVIMAILSLIGFGLFLGIPNATAPESDTPWFRNEDGVLYFDESLYEGSVELEIPEYVDGKPVTSLGKKCFAGCDRLTTVHLPETLTTIEDQAFANCTSLQGIFIPGRVASIGKNAFSKCTSLEAISIPESVNEIKSGAFNGCSGLKYIMYDDTCEAWKALYSEFIGPETEVHCTDGTHPQGE